MAETVTANRDEETGRFKREFPLSSFLDEVDTLDPATTTDVADAIGCSYDLAYRRLKELEDSGDVEAQQVGNTFIWTTSN
jgi:hypothetical protein